MAHQDHPEWLIRRLEQLPEQTDATYEMKAHLVRNLSHLPREAERDSDLQQYSPLSRNRRLRIWFGAVRLPCPVIR